MSTGKKVLNIFGIIFSIFLSILLVVMLISSVMTLSALSILQPKTLAKTVTGMDIGPLISSVAEEAGQALEQEQQEMLSAVIKSDGVKEVVEAFAQDAINALTGTDAEAVFSVQMLQEALKADADQIAEALQKKGGEFANVSQQELADKIRDLVDENGEALTELIPDTQSLKTLVEEDPTMKQAMAVIAATDTIKMALILIVVILCALIFVCRLFDWRGFKWLSIDLLIAGLITGLVGYGMATGKAVLSGLAGENALVNSLLDGVLGTFSEGLILRTAVMILVAVVCMAAYLLIRKALKKKVSAPVAPVTPVAPAAPAQLQSAEAAEENKEAVEENKEAE